MNKEDKKFSGARVTAVVLAGALGAQAGTASAQIKYSGDNWGVNFFGYLRQYVSMNLEDAPENPGDDKYRLSMVRTQFQPSLEGYVGPVDFRLQARSVREVETGYLEDLEDIGANSGDDLVDDVYNEDEIREAYIDFDLADTTNVRLGRQQVAFGETDFFQALDLIHGFDFTWRSFLVSENEDIRKPLNMLNVTQRVTPWQGAFQALVIPGGDLNRDRDFGTSYGLSGGRWSNQPNKGVDFLNDMVSPYQYDHDSGDTDKLKGALRWTGLSPEGTINYSLNYLRVHNPDPVFNSAFAPYENDGPDNGFASLIYPIVDVFGLTASGYSVTADAVFSTEIAYTRDKPFNVGGDPSVCGAGATGIPGICGVEEKDVVSLMVRMDKQVGWTQEFLNTSRPSFFSVQVFDDYIVDLENSDDLVQLVGYSAPPKSHSVIATAILGLNYANDTINPQLAAGYDMSYGGGFLIPSVQFAWGDNLRLKVEADIFFDDGNTQPGGSPMDSRDTTIFGYFDNNDQLMARFTYQF
ncbi:MAG: DUF1302 domain-containing protein [Spiribacter salinus]|uniref:DUF1302 domain-containing protein n=1 Tax=Spiribacter salinus TaxID=1335746 RepID=A0A540VV48_9GAMM|nr:MAG: DUF1302 domain-containing protein [Spiribacter salinus]